MKKSKEKTWHSSEVKSRTSWRLSKKPSKKKFKKTVPMPGWINEEIDDHIHVYPPEDFVLHGLDNDADCICGPDTIFGNHLTLIVHHSLDGREFAASGFTKHREVW